MGEFISQEKTVYLDDVLVKFKSTGRYHVILLCLVNLANVFNGIYSVNYIFTAEKSNYSCKDGDVNSSVMCSVSGVNGTGCSEWIYDNPHSFVAEFQLACQEWKRTLVGTTHSIGYMMGLLLIGPLSDRLGRKTTVIITGVAQAVFGLAKSFAQSYWLFVALEFSEAIFGVGYSPLFNLAVEVVDIKRRPAFVTMCDIGFSLGGILLALAAWNFEYWRTFLKVIYTPAFIFLLYIFLIDESPRWLMSKGKFKEAKTIIEKAAKTNGMKLDKQLLERLSVEQEEKVKLTELYKITFSSKTLLKRFLICVVWWISCTFVNYGLLINSVSLQGNKYVNLMILNATGIPGLFLISCILRFCTRKVALTLGFLCCAILCLTQPFIPKNLIWLSTTLYILGSFCGILAFLTTYLFTCELFPTYTRNSMHALCSSLGRVGSIVAPQTPLLLKYWEGLPAVLFGGAALLAGALTFLVPDTAEDALPDTVRQAEAIGNHKRPPNTMNQKGHTDDEPVKICERSHL